ncbi:MAG: bifunctional oligoribonuclease/PAP phosphatase NrnA [Planctomycetales bacterium]|nr:bifunctional oligoribonuclease/PAP phosphatase NrnA [Planctomycetales bacterium]
MKLSTTIDWRPLAELIERHDVFLLTTHCRADCDALGSELGLAMALESLGKRVVIVNGDEPPPHISFLDEQNRACVLGTTAPLEALRGVEAIIVVDTGARVQLGPMAAYLDNFTGSKAVIDHHVSGDELGALVLKDAKSESTGRLILELIDFLDVELTQEIAVPLFAAIATDTGWFRFSSVTEQTFLALSRLVAAGASPPALFSQLYEQHTLPRLLLRGRILDHVEAMCDGRLMWTYVSAEDFAATDAELTDTEDSINSLLTVAGVEAAAMFVELEPEKTKVSLRSRSGFDVSAVAEQFGGGGHKAAAGITVQEPLADAQKSILDALCKALG